MKKSFLTIGLGTLCLAWLALFALIHLSDSARERMPLPLLVLLSSDDGIRGGDWEENASAGRPAAEHVIEVFLAEGVPDSLLADAEPEGKGEEEGDEDETIASRYTVELDPEQGEVLHSEVMAGDSAGKLLAEWLGGDYMAALKAARPVYRLSKIRIGQPFSIVRDPENGDFRSFRYEIDDNRVLVLRRKDKGFDASLEKIGYEVALTRVRGVITTSLSEAVVNLGEPVSLALVLARAFASEINFITDLRVGDSFDILVEKKSRGGEFKGYGHMLAARFVNRGKAHEAYLFRNGSGRLAYFNRKGESLHRTLLKAPLSFLRVTSRYSMARRHPVFGTVRPHQGVDYGAPHGTPIMAVGDGVVTMAGRVGGYGNQVVIRHSGGLESLYGHMSRFARGIRQGVKVSQGQTIGYVGSTGTATGPHLDFRIRQRGAFVNPARLVAPRDEGIARKRMDQFQRIVADVDAYWHGKELASYEPSAWL